MNSGAAKLRKQMQPTATLDGMPDGVLSLIAGHLSGQGVYSLLTSTKRLAARPAEFKRRMLQTALRTRLDEVIAGCNPLTGELADARHARHFTLADLFPDGPVLDAEARPQLVVAGSSVVRAIVPETNAWSPGGVDIFCTQQALPRAQRLLFEAGMICAGNVLFAPGHHHNINTPLHNLTRGGGFDLKPSEVYDVVEVVRYCPLPRTPEAADAIGIGKATEDDLPWDAVEYRSKVEEDGTKWVKDMELYEYRDDIHQRGVPLHTDGPILVDERLYGVAKVNLIVADRGCTDVREIFGSFDLNVCRSYFDGAKFVIPDPGRTLRGQTLRTEARKELVDEFLKGIPAAVAKLDLAGSEYRFFDAIHQVSSATMKRTAMSGVGWDRQVVFVMLLIARAQKYSVRGVEIVDAHPALLRFKDVVVFPTCAEGGEWPSQMFSKAQQWDAAPALPDQPAGIVGLPPPRGWGEPNTEDEGGGMGVCSDCDDYDFYDFESSCSGDGT